MTNTEFVGVVEPEERSTCRNCGVLIGRYTVPDAAIRGWWHNDSGFDDRCVATTAEPVVAPPEENNDE